MRPTRPVSSCSSRRAPASGCSPKSMPPPGSVHAPGASVMLLKRQTNKRSDSSTQTLYAATRCEFSSLPRELRVALLAERGHAFGKIGRVGGECLEVRLELEDVRQVALERCVEQPLRQAEGARRARREAARRASAPREATARHPRRSGTRDRGSTASAPVAPSPSITIALARGRPTSRGSRYAPPASATSPHFENVQRNFVRGCTSTKSHAEREMRARADRRAVHGSNGWFVELPEFADERLYARRAALPRSRATRSRVARPAQPLTPTDPYRRRMRRRCR